MNRNSIVKLIRQMNTTELAGEKVMIDFETGKYYMLKGVGNDIWDMIQQEISVEDIIQKLLTEYDVTEEECEKSVLDFLTNLQKVGIVA